MERKLDNAYAVNPQLQKWLDKLGLFGWVLGIAGFMVSGLVASLTEENGVRRFLHAYLINWVFFTSITLGALFFVILQYLTRAGWSVVIRRFAEVLASNIALLMALFVPILVAMLRGDSHLFPWVDTEAMLADHALAHKMPYLNVPFFAVRFCFYTFVWVLISQWFRRQSLKQDAEPGVRITATLQRTSAPAMLLFGPSITFFAFDMLMSLNPHWYSTIFGVYFFAGSVISFLAFTIVSLQLLSDYGFLPPVVTVEHYHDLGKLLFGFTFFWGYVAFSQYMLTWYANIPEETHWYLMRQSNGWTAVSLLLLFGHLLIPFPSLLSRHVKRHRSALRFMALWMLVFHWVDLYWVVMPQGSSEGPVLGPIELACWLGFGGLFIAGLAYQARGVRMVPKNDPRLNEALAFENI